MATASDLQLSPSKKRSNHLSVSDDENILVTPKKLRAAHALSTPSTNSRKPATQVTLTKDLQRLHTLHTIVQQALSHALATSAISPTEDTGLVLNVINHLYLTKRGYTLKELSQICWIWEWDATLPYVPPAATAEDDNPFLEPSKPAGKSWQRGSMGIVVTPHSHFERQLGKRVPVYGIGVEVEMDIDKGFTDGMAAVARWSADGVYRKSQVQRKLAQWMLAHEEHVSYPEVPSASFPVLEPISNASVDLQRRIASRSPSPTKLAQLKAGQSLSSPRTASPTLIKGPSTPSFQIPFPSASSSVPTTPSARRKAQDVLQTPSSSRTTPTTPSTGGAIPATPSSSRREALYERIRQRSMSNTPEGSPVKDPASREKFRALGAAMMRRRCLLGRLSNVAEGIWMLFSGPASSQLERRALRLSTVVHAAVKSSPVPMSEADAEDSIDLLTELCPFFLRRLNIDREEWLEMPSNEERSVEKHAEDASPRSLATEDSPRKASPRKIVIPRSPGFSEKRHTKDAVLSHSPKSIKKPRSCLAIVREKIRKELEIHD